jgi:hypothetical protein
MSAYGTSFIGLVEGEERLHWTMQPFWHHLNVQVHGDGVSVQARDDRVDRQRLVPPHRRPSVGTVQADRASAGRSVAA